MTVISTMTVNELYNLGKKKLSEACIEDFEFDSRCLLEFCLSIGTTDFLLSKNNAVDSETEKEYFRLIERRTAGEPLQYILGKWEFMGLPFYVGEGVLIPRPETELLVEFAVDFLKDKKNPIVFDLCSGSGCIAISVAKLVKNASVFAVEKSSEAFGYLKKNISLNSADNVTALNGDIFDKKILCDITPDLILSNPPYIRSEDINTLQLEVRKEPVMALDGGDDGYDFYRELADNWLVRLSDSGAIAVECAEDQTETISKMFGKVGKKISVINDLSGLPRVVTAHK